MSARLFITPAGTVRAESDAALEQAFGAGGGAGLLALLKDGAPPDAEPSVHFFRRIAREFAARLCRVPEDEPETMFRAARPDAAAAGAALFDRPPMTGGEYLSADLLLKLCGELEAAMREELEKSGLTVPDYLRTLSPAWSSVGKVGFHLA